MVLLLEEIPNADDGPIWSFSPILPTRSYRMSGFFCNVHSLELTLPIVIRHTRM